MFLRGARGEDVQELDDLDKEIALLKQELHSKANVAESRFVQLQHLFKDRIEPLMSLVCKKLGAFDELFHVTHAHLSIETDEETTSTGANRVVDVPTIVADLWEKASKKGADVRRIWVRIEWINLKGDTLNAKPFKLASEFECISVPHALIIVFKPEGKQVGYSIDEAFDLSLVDQLIGAVGKSLLARIRGRIEM